MDTKLKGFLQSSQDPTVVANKIKGLILAASSIIIFFAAQLFHITLNGNDVVTIATELSTIAGAIWAVYGCVLNIVTWWGTVRR